MALYVGYFVIILLGVSNFFAAFVHRCLIECRDEYKYNVEAVELLIRNHLVNMQQYDLHLAQVNISHSLKEKKIGKDNIFIV